MSQTIAAAAVTTLSPAVQTETSTSGLDTIVEEIARLLLDNGAQIDPGLTVVEDLGHMTLGTRTGRIGEQFISLPTQVLVPIDNLTWDDAAATVRPVGGVDALSPVQRTLLDLHSQLWNTTGKLAQFRDTHPRAAAIADQDLVDAIRLLRASFTPGASTRDMLKTRTFSLRSQGSVSSVVMPILELADHDPLGAPYNLTDAGLSSNYRFVDDSGLTFVSYGPRRDAVDLACLYGFATSNTTFFVSAPMSVDLGRFGRLTLERGLDRRRASAWRIDGDTLMVDYLALDAHVGLFEDFHRPLRRFLEDRGASRSESMSMALAAADTVLHENLRRLADVIDIAGRGSHMGAATVARAAQHQRTVIDVIGELA